MSDLNHTAYGYWLEEAGPVVPQDPLIGHERADVVIVGGGYLGLWTAWRLAELEPEARVAIVEAATCGHGPSGRNGGFVSSLWGRADELRERHGDDAARAVCRASAESVREIGRFCAEQEVDAWYVAAPQISVATAPAQEGLWSRAVAACADLGAADELRPLSPAEVAAHCRSPAFGAGTRAATAATVQPARLALGLRAALLARGVVLWEGSRACRLSATPGGVTVETRSGGRVSARRAVLALGPASGALRPLRSRLAVASSHMVLTEPVPDLLEEIGWAGGEAIRDWRTMLHYFRTTPDGRIAFGWGGGRMTWGARPRRALEVDEDVVARTRERLVRFFPGLAGRRLTHAWGGPIDVSPTHLPTIVTDGPVCAGFGFTGNGVGPSHLCGRILASLALDRRDELTRLALVDPEPRRFPPEPLRYAGGAMIRRALVTKDRAEDEGRPAGPVVDLVAGLPARLGMNLPR